MRKVLLTLLAAFAFTGLAVAGPRDDMLAAYLRVDYTTAARLAKPLADAGDVVAQYLYGKMQREVSKNNDEAVIWLKKAAEKGHVPAQAELGFLLAYEMKQRAEGRAWMEKAVAAKHPPSFKDLGWLIERDVATPKGLADAAELYRQGSELDDRDARALYANALARGRGVAQDLPAAAKLYCQLGTPRWLLQCATTLIRAAPRDTGSPEAVGILDKLVAAGDLKAMVELSEYRLGGPAATRNTEEAVRLLRRAADGGEAGAFFNLGSLAQRGVGMEKNWRIAFDWYRKAAEAGHYAGFGRMAYLVGQGFAGQAPDPVEAVRLYRLGVGRDDDVAREMLAAHLFAGHGVAKDQSAAADIFCQLDTAFANFRCGSLILDGKAPEKDSAAAIKLLKRSAERGEKGAQRQLGSYYLKGQYVEKNLAEGVRLTKLAVDGGDEVAYNNLGVIRENGWEGKADLAEAYRWYLKAAEGGYAAAFAEAARLLKSGATGKPDPEAAIALLKKGAALGDENAMTQLTTAAYSREGVPKGDYSLSDILCQHSDQRSRYHCAQLIMAGKARETDVRKGFALLGALSDEGYSDAQIIMARHYLKGTVLARNVAVKKNIPEGLRLTQLSVKQGNRWAYFTMGAVYEWGIGVSTNVLEASQWYELAAEQNDEEALVALGRLYEKGALGKVDADLARTFYRRAADVGSAEGKKELARMTKGSPGSQVLDFRPPQ